MKYKDENGEWQDIYLPPTGDTLPIGAIVEYDGDKIPYGYESVGDRRIKKIKNAVGMIGNVVDDLSANGQYDVPNTQAVRGKMLWTNPRPYNTFPSQIISLGDYKYDVIEIFYYDFKDTRRVLSNKLLKGENGILQSIFQYTDNGFIGSRAITDDGNNQLIIGDNVTVVQQNNFVRQANNEWNIPIYIVGYNTGLFN